jgi:hypothetical protein
MAYIPGDRVTWLHQSRGGRCQLTPVEAVVEKVGKKVKIQVALRVPEGWAKVTRLVDHAKLKPRTVACAALGETDKCFVLTQRQHGHQANE